MGWPLHRPSSYLPLAGPLMGFYQKGKNKFCPFCWKPFFFFFFFLLRLFNFPKRSGNCVGLTSSKATTFWLPHNQWTESALEAVLILLHAYTELGMTLSCGFGLGGLDYWKGKKSKVREKERQGKRKDNNCNYLITAGCCTRIGIPECKNWVVLTPGTNWTCGALEVEAVMYQKLQIVNVD